MVKIVLLKRYPVKVCYFTTYVFAQWNIVIVHSTTYVFAQLNIVFVHK